MKSVRVDWVYLATSAIPGLVAADFVKPGDQNALIAGGLTSAAGAEYVFADDDKTSKFLRDLYKTAPLLGFGSGYFLGRIGGLSPMQCLLSGVLTAGVLTVLHKNQGPKVTRILAGESDPTYHVPEYQAVNDAGDSPMAAAASPPYGA